MDIATQDWLGLAIDLGSTLYDGLATVVPGLPGGAGVLRTPARISARARVLPIGRPLA